MGVSRVCPGLLATALERSERQRSETPSRNFVSKFKFELRKNPPAPVGGEAWSSAKHSQHKFTVAFVGEKGLLFCLECRSYRSYQTFWKKDILDKNRGPHGEHVFLGNNLNIEWWPKNVYKYELQYSNADVWGLVEQMCGILNTLKQVNHKELTKKNSPPVAVAPTVVEVLTLGAAPLATCWQTAEMLDLRIHEWHLLRNLLNKISWKDWTYIPTYSKWHQHISNSSLWAFQVITLFQKHSPE